VAEGETAAADALGEMVAELSHQLDALVEVVAPALRDARPVLPGGRAVVGQQGQRLADAGERDAQALRGADEGDPAQGVTAVAALVAGGAAAVDQTLALLEA
jgi:hypothetical protein